MTPTEPKLTPLFDLSEWPLVVARFPELDEPDRVRRLAEGVDQLLARQEPFAVVWLMASHDHDDEPREDDRAAHIWLKRVLKDLNRFVQGYAYVAPNAEIRDVLGERIKKVGSKLFAFPTYISDDRDGACAHARDWLAKGQ